jgi:hypothetical protein
MGEVRITTAEGTPVEGVATGLSDLRGLGAWAFTPSSPWLPGSYLAAYADGQPAPFAVLDTVVSPPAATPGLSSPRTESRDSVRCVTAEGEAEFPMVTWTHGLFHVDLSGTWESQYTYVVEVNGETDLDPYGSGASFEIGPDLTQICYSVRAERLVSKEETLLVDECYSPSELAQFVSGDPSFEEYQTFLRDRCILPPTGRVDDWCSTFQPAIDQGKCDPQEFPNVEGCESALGGCVLGPDSFYADPAQFEPADADSSTAGGCSVLAPDGSSLAQAGGGLFVLLASLAAARLRPSARLALGRPDRRSRRVRSSRR